MVTHIALMNFTEQGLKGIKDTTQRAAAAKEAATRVGVTMREIYWTVGQYDLVCVLDGKDSESITAFALSVARQGNVRSTSLLAFDAAAMDRMLKQVA